MKYKLRDYQVKASDIGVQHLKTYGNPFVLVLATGAGKSLIVADICHKLDEPTLILQPSKEILEQNYNKLKSYGVEDVAIYSASMKSKKIDKFTYATIKSIYKKPDLFKHFKYVIIDECHQVNPKNLGGMYKTFLDSIGCKNVCGLTATPYRLTQRYFEEDGKTFYTSKLSMINRIHPFFFKNIVCKVETAELIEQKYLCPILYRSDKEVDLLELEVNSTGADFTEESLERFWQGRGGHRLKKLAQIIQRIDEHCQRSLVFCSSISQAEDAMDMLSDMGIGSSIVTGKTPLDEREDTIAQYRRGEIKHMFNVGVFTTGFDVPELDCVILARPTMSLALYYQMVGRGVRIDPARPEKKLRVYDLAGVVAKLGRVETIKVVKEGDGFRDMVVSEAGVMTDVPLFKYLVTKNKPKFKQAQLEVQK